MSLFDPPNEEKLSDAFPEGTAFMLYSAEYEGIRGTSFGDSHQATVSAGPADRTGEPKDYRVFGRLAEQVKQLDSDDLPSLVEVVKQGRAHVWKRAEQSDEVPF